MATTSRTRAQMREAALIRADLDGYDSLTDIANLLLQSRIRALYDMLITCHDEYYYRDRATKATVVDQSDYTFAGDFGVNNFYRLLELHADDGTNFARVPPFDDVDHPHLLEQEQSGSAWSVYRYRHALRPTGIEVLPAPTTTAHTLTLWYVPACPDLDTDDSTFDGINGWERWAEIGTAIDLRQREELDASPLIGELGYVEAAIKRLAGNRDLNAAKVRLTRAGWRHRRRWRADYDGESW